MKRVVVVFLLVSMAILAKAQDIIFHENILFPQGQTTLSDEQRAKIDAIAMSMDYGQKLMLYPLCPEKGGFPLSFATDAEEQAESIQEYVSKIGFKDIRIQTNFPSAYRGRSVGLSMKRTIRREAESLAKAVTEEPTDPGHDDFDTHYPEKPSQFFLVNTRRDTVIQGAEGTLLYLAAGCFVTKGAQARVELKEFYKLDDYIKGGMQTASNGVMLQSGGSIYLDAREESPKKTPLKLNQEKGVKIDFTLGKNDPEMKVFLKDKSAKGFNWLPQRSSKTITTTIWTDEEGNIISEEEAKRRMNEWKQAEDMAKEMTKQDKMQSQFQSKLQTFSLGYINCDRFPDEPLQQLAVKADPDRFATYYLVFKNVRGMMKGQQNGQQVSFGRVPLNREATLLAVSFKDKQGYFYTTNVNVSTAAATNIKLSAVPEEQINAALAQLK